MRTSTPHKNGLFNITYARTRARACARALSPSLTAPHERNPPDKFCTSTLFKVIEIVILVDLQPPSFGSLLQHYAMKSIV